MKVVFFAVERGGGFHEKCRKKNENGVKINMWKKYRAQPPVRFRNLGEIPDPHEVEKKQKKTGIGSKKKNG